jgi:hypothetical protein
MWAEAKLGSKKICLGAFFFTFALSSVALANRPALVTSPLPAPKFCAHEPKEILAANPHGRTVFWDLEEEDSLHQAYGGGDPLYERFRAWVLGLTPWKWSENLSNHRQIALDILANPNLDQSSRSFLEKHVRNITYILTGQVGRIHGISCLESLPFRELLGTVDIRNAPAEFYATLPRRDDRWALIADVYGDNLYSVEETEAARGRRLELQANGWRLVATYHNHPFHQPDSMGDFGGVLLPSFADLQLHDELEPEYSLISNGLDTLGLVARDAEILQADEGKTEGKPGKQPATQ